MADGDCCGDGISTSVLSAAKYDGAEGVQKQIRLMDAIEPLLGLVPPLGQLLLSNHPITTPWPLAVNDKSQEHRPQHDAKRRRREGNIESRLKKMEDVIVQEIPIALKELRRKRVNEDWLNASNDEYAVIDNEQGKKEGISWTDMEVAESSEGVKEIKSPLLLLDGQTSKEDVQNLIHRLIVCQSHTGASLQCLQNNLPSSDIYFPSRSACLLTNILRSQLEPPSYGWNQLISFAKDHPPDLLLMDPPYPSYSAKRLNSKQEKYEPINDLYDLWNMKKPVQELLDCHRDKRGVIVGCWVTNNVKVQRFVLTKLFPAWGVQHFGQTVWIKVTRGGQLVFPLENKQGRKPYEILLLGQTKSDIPLPSIDTTTLFASVPLGHSRKPSVFDLLHHLLFPTSTQVTELNVYELFARSLASNSQSKGYWVSIGNEPFAFNQEGVGYISKQGRSKG